VPTQELTGTPGPHQAQGKRLEAVEKYKANFNYASDKKEVLKRIVEQELVIGNKEEARRWVDRGLDQRIDASYESAEAQQMLDEAKNAKPPTKKG
jgi:hypothetical protein